jgi:hypothetical protein
MRTRKQSNIGYGNSFNNVYTYRSTAVPTSRRKTANQNTRRRYNLGLNDDLSMKSSGGLQPLRLNVPNQTGTKYDIIPHATPRVMVNERNKITPRNNSQLYNRSFMSSKMEE